MDTRQIPLTKGYVAIVDAADYDWLNQWSWCAYTHGHRNPIVYPARKPKTGTVHMSRLILDAPPGLDAFHWDGDRLNCTRANLTTCTRAQTISARPPRGRKYKGVQRVGEYNRWLAYAGDTTHTYAYLGCFPSPELAARAYDERARELWGPFAWLNFPDAAQ